MKKIEECEKPKIKGFGDVKKRSSMRRLHRINMKCKFITLTLL